MRLDQGAGAARPGEFQESSGQVALAKATNRARPDSFITRIGKRLSGFVLICRKALRQRFSEQKVRSSLTSRSRGRSPIAPALASAMSSDKWTGRMRQSILRCFSSWRSVWSRSHSRGYRPEYLDSPPESCRSPRIRTISNEYYARSAV